MSWDAVPTGMRARQRTYSDAALQTCLSMKGEERPGNLPVACFSPGRRPGLFGMVDMGAPLVQATLSTGKTTGFVERLLRPVGTARLAQVPLEIRAVEITGNHVDDAPILPDLLGQIPEDLETDGVTADGARLRPFRR